jgi:hypothetical protein
MLRKSAERVVDLESAVPGAFELFLSELIGEPV